MSEMHSEGPMPINKAVDYLLTLQSETPERGSEEEVIIIIHRPA